MAEVLKRRGRKELLSLNEGGWTVSVCNEDERCS
jgi:hypothetical protein